MSGEQFPEPHGMQAEEFYPVVRSEPGCADVAMALCYKCGRELGARDMLPMPRGIELVAEACEDFDECARYRAAKRAFWVLTGPIQG